MGVSGFLVGTSVFCLVAFLVGSSVKVGSGKGVVEGVAVSVGMSVFVLVNVGVKVWVISLVGTLVSSRTTDGVGIVVEVDVGEMSTFSFCLNTRLRRRRVSNIGRIAYLSRLILLVLSLRNES